MTITSQDARDEYTATAGQTVFNYTFKIYADTDLDVYITPAGQDSDDSADLTTAYTVDPSTISNPNGGFITLDSGANSGDLVTIVSSMPYNRTVDYQNSGDFLPDTVNGDNDRQVSQIKQVVDLAERTFRFQNSQQGVQNVSLPAPLANGYWRWNSDGTEIEFTLAPGSEIVDTDQEITGTWTWQDRVEARFGTGNDAQIFFFDPLNAFTVNLDNDSNFYLNKDGTLKLAYGGVEDEFFVHTKFRYLDGVPVTFGDTDRADLFYFQPLDAFSIKVFDDTNLYIQSGNDLKLAYGGVDDEFFVHVSFRYLDDVKVILGDDDDVSLYYDSATSEGRLNLDNGTDFKLQQSGVDIFEWDDSADIFIDHKPIRLTDNTELQFGTGNDTQAFFFEPLNAFTISLDNNSNLFINKEDTLKLGYGGIEDEFFFHTDFRAMDDVSLTLGDDADAKLYYDSATNEARFNLESNADFKLQNNNSTVFEFDNSSDELVATAPINFNSTVSRDSVPTFAVIAGGVNSATTRDYDAGITGTITEVINANDREYTYTLSQNASSASNALIVTANAYNFVTAMFTYCEQLSINTFRIRVSKQGGGDPGQAFITWQVVDIGR